MANKVINGIAKFLYATFLVLYFLTALGIITEIAFIAIFVGTLFTVIGIAIAAAIRALLINIVHDFLRSDFVKNIKNIFTRNNTEVAVEQPVAMPLADLAIQPVPNEPPSYEAALDCPVNYTSPITGLNCAPPAYTERGVAIYETAPVPAYA